MHLTYLHENLRMTESGILTLFILSTVLHGFALKLEVLQTLISDSIILYITLYHSL